MRFDGEGQPRGLPLGGMDGVVVGEPVRQFGRAVPEPPLRGIVGWMGMTDGGCGGWVSAPVKTGSGSPREKRM